MKRTDHILKAFEIAKQSLPDLKLVVAGKAEGRYGKRVVEAIARSPYAADISYLGPVSPEHKIALMRKAHVLCVTSVKEGWGLVVTEANSQGTPAVVYDVDGLRDSVKDGVTGIVCGTNTPKEMGESLVKLLSQQEKYQNFRRQAWKWSKDVHFDYAYTDFASCLSYV
jgi:glycosyltransferase involved in cell wall biosynthesis